MNINYYGNYKKSNLTNIMLSQLNQTVKKTLSIKVTIKLKIT